MHLFIKFCLAQVKKIVKANEKVTCSADPNFYIKYKDNNNNNNNNNNSNFGCFKILEYLYWCT